MTKKETVREIAHWLYQEIADNGDADLDNDADEYWFYLKANEFYEEFVGEWETFVAKDGYLSTSYRTPNNEIRRQQKEDSLLQIKNERV